MKSDLPIDCVTCRSTYDGTAWDFCPVCRIAKLEAQVDHLERAINEAMDFLDEQAPLHARDALAGGSSLPPPKSLV